ncbi:killer cell lectin-like receptor subfamily F member 2 isoform X2 [Cuculus canorus]|uniref:killer cell lectin-like receptor subfamily F member 2 isoform X2 n=1 Tax=Cuculus canorus TaxID=55661 RepID=UPI0023AA396A|nr:killer cell lectin-like receptor subfamily F member 2 isoform X2 [Cuculus canorus]
MPENLIYADLNLTESTKPRLQVTDIQGSMYAEVKVQSLDTNAAANYTSSSKRCCSRTRVYVLAAVIILLLVLGVCLIVKLTSGLVLATETSRDPLWPDENYTQGNTGCPQDWEENRGKCYFFSPKQKINDWNASRQECTDMNSDLHYLYSQSRHSYYLLGLVYHETEKKWKWINNMEHSTDMFAIGGDFTDYFCAVIGFHEVETAPCSGALTTQNMCEKAANISERQKEELKPRGPGRTVIPSLL